VNNILKTSEQIVMPVSTSNPLGKGIKQLMLGVKRSGHQAEGGLGGLAEASFSPLGLSAL